MGSILNIKMDINLVKFDEQSIVLKVVAFSLSTHTVWSKSYDESISYVVK